jgi:hypothetical protein
MRFSAVIFTLLVSTFHLYAQNDTLSTTDSNTYRIVKTDGGELVGTIISQDAREVFFRTQDGRKIIIPQHVIQRIVLLDPKEFNAKGEFVGEDKFATRYFITTNGLPIKKKEHYVQWNLFGPDFQFGVGENFGVGVMTSWVGIPIIGTIKKSWQINDKTHVAIGALVGTGTWAAPDVGGALPFATLSFGSRSGNLSFSGGYGAVWEDGDVMGRAITSVAGMAKVSSKISLVFDSFILLPTTEEAQRYRPNGEQYTAQIKRRGFYLFIPGLRWHQAEGKALQFGFSGMVIDGDLVPVPIPTLQFYRSL